MAIYKTVQTGAKTQLGGLKKGLFWVGNHVKTLSMVTNDDKKPMATQRRMQKAILANLFMWKSIKLFL